MTFCIGDRVKILFEPVYNGIGIPGDIGVIIGIRPRYVNLPQAYNQYKIYFEGKSTNKNFDNFDDMYTDLDLQIISTNLFNLDQP